MSIAEAAQPTFTRVFLGIGSNLERLKHIQAGVHSLAEAFAELSLSPIYESEAYGFSGPAFYNLVAEVRTELSLADVQQICRQIELAHGRPESAEKYSSRTLDIDVLLYGDCIQDATANEPALPRSDILTRAYVLKPLADLVPFALHPQTQQSYQALWRDMLQQQAQHGDGMASTLMQQLPLTWSQVLAQGTADVVA
ncbi:MAG: 2-amino-4-hydroxy-6-hydroxymethyldihydropteridine diphosphokinase [Gammaproteobacteria bacterium]|nr:2-amino-4-hydroxy-6-hydroxymethyldihydropteridine diphosphokinase [Gammaproteobacteria bacterium]MCL5255786.1 2-amino-4-hydroxy-6-hydroxymethyldihydropteridine diphosphokinase [Gammaproteobacteria bacterium]